MTKYFCDTCQKQLFSRQDLNEVRIAPKPKHEAELSPQYKLLVEICSDCLTSLQNFIRHKTELVS